MGLFLQLLGCDHASHQADFGGLLPGEQGRELRGGFEPSTNGLSEGLLRKPAHPNA
jgi:hypothetical protein